MLPFHKQITKKKKQGEICNSDLPVRREVKFNGSSFIFYEQVQYDSSDHQVLSHTPPKNQN